MDPIADMFAQIKNASAAGQESLTVPASKIKMAILEILKKNRKIANFCEIKVDAKSKAKRKIEINLFDGFKSNIKRVSSPGKRVYAKMANIPRPKTFRGLIIVSTPRGIMTGEEARKKGLGGEVIAEVM